MESEQVKIVYGKKIYKRYSWTIPIIFQDNKWFTGQDLTYEKMIGKELLTEEERKKYPIVINPDTFYKVPSGRIFDKNDAYDQALHKLCILSEKIAPNKREYEPMRHIGYFEDKKAEAEVASKHFNKKYQAMQCVMEMSDTDYDSVVLMLNYTAKKEEFNIDMRNSNKNEKFTAINLLIEKNPDLVLSCFEKYNPGIKDDLFIMKLIHHKLIIKRGMDFHESNANGMAGNYIGNSIERVKDYLVRKDNVFLKDKFNRMLTQIETGQTVTVPKEMLVDKVDPQNQINMLIAQIGMNLIDEDMDLAKTQLEKLMLLTSPNDSTYLKLQKRYDAIVNNNASNEILSFEEQKAIWESMELTDLVDYIKNNKPNEFNIVHINNYKDDKDKVLEYMLTKRRAKLDKINNK